MTRAGDNVKLCVDCKWSSGGRLYPECQHPKGNHLNLATGETTRTLSSCSVIRDMGPFGRAVFFWKFCGKSAPFFEPKEGGKS